MCFLTRASASGGTGSLFLIHFNPRFREGSDTNMYNFLVYICKNHSTTYKLIIIFLFHSVKQINYSYWKTCESSRLVKYTYNIDQISSTTEFQSTASSQKATANMHNHSLHTCINHSNTHKIIILSASIAVNPIKISNFTSANLPTFYVHF